MFTFVNSRRVRFSRRNFRVSKEKWRRHPDSNRGMKVLQTCPLTTWVWRRLGGNILLVRRVKSAFVEFNLFRASFSGLSRGLTGGDVLVEIQQIA